MGKIPTGREMSYLSPSILRREVSSLLAGSFTGEAYLAYMDRFEVEMVDTVEILIDGEHLATADLADLQIPLQEFSSKVLVPAIRQAYLNGRFGGREELHKNPLVN